MTWFRVDDTLAHHAKTERLEAAHHEAQPYALALWLLAGSDCAFRLTDGRVSRLRLGKLVSWPDATIDAAVAALLDVGFWERTSADGEYLFHDWDKYQPTAASVRKERAESAERQRRARESRTLSRRDSRRDNQRDFARDSRRDFARPDPTRPDPINYSESAAGPATQDATPESPLQLAERLLVQGYQRRYEAAARDAWQSVNANRRQIGEVAAYVVQTAEPAQAVVDDVLDGAFADAWMREHRWPWGRIAQDPGRLRTRKAAPRKTRVIEGVEYDDETRTANGLTAAENAENARIRRRARGGRHDAP